MYKIKSRIKPITGTSLCKENYTGLINRLTDNKTVRLNQTVFLNTLNYTDQIHNK